MRHDLSLVDYERNGESQSCSKQTILVDSVTSDNCELAAKTSWEHPDESRTSPEEAGLLHGWRPAK